MGEKFPNFPLWWINPWQKVEYPPTDAEGHLHAQVGVGAAVEVLQPLHADLPVTVALSAGGQDRLQLGAAVGVLQTGITCLVTRGAELVTTRGGDTRRAGVRRVETWNGRSVVKQSTRGERGILRYEAPEAELWRMRHEPRETTGVACHRTGT